MSSGAYDAGGASGPVGQSLHAAVRSGHTVAMPSVTDDLARVLIGASRAA